MHGPDLTRLACDNATAKLPGLPVEAVVEVDGADKVALPRECDELVRLGQRGCKRLLADDVLASFERTLDVLVVEMVGRGHVDDVDRRVAEQRFEVVVRRGQCGSERLVACMLGRGTDDAGDMHSETRQGVGVDGGHETRPDDRRRHVAEARRPQLSSLCSARHPTPRSASPRAASTLAPTTPASVPSSLITIGRLRVASGRERR